MGGMSGFTMIQSAKYNRNIILDRKKMGQNPYALKGISPEKRDSKEYKELIQHRFSRKSQSSNISLIIYGSLMLIVMLTILYNVL